MKYSLRPKAALKLRYSRKIIGLKYNMGNPGFDIRCCDDTSCRDAQTAYVNVFSRLLLECERFLCDACAQDSRVVSPNMFQCRGGYELVEQL